MALTAIFSLMAAVIIGYTQAAPACDPSSVMSCVMPMMMYAQSPEAQQLQVLQQTGREQDITKPQITAMCKVIQGITTCGAGYLERCAPPEYSGIRDIQTFTRGTVKLMEVCDRPDLHPKAVVMITCTKMLNSSGSVYQTCLDQSKNSLSYLQNNPNPARALEILRSGRVLKDVCCLMKSSYACLESEIRKCSQEAVDTNTQMYNAIMEAYGCPAKIAEGCPPAAA
ncbi:hypothetical protein BV898_04186 [Hypsibius exemplaris]|uniref:DUF19 domain-containing protein n=1 Tax=Hypsibius exemplaris TaxID=2072580 RepID=A0A1W0X391_HYPEX|nr:hypothetical protein BV898_04186 [Hypsibius exemplaris]